MQVPAGSYFMMGDNRDNSFDSRYFGVVERNRILGQATTVVLSLNRDNYWLPRCGTVLEGRWMGNRLKRAEDTDLGPRCCP